MRYDVVFCRSLFWLNTVAGNLAGSLQACCVGVSIPSCCFSGLVGVILAGCTAVLYTEGPFIAGCWFLHGSKLGEIAIAVGVFKSNLILSLCNDRKAMGTISSIPCWHL